MGYMSFYIFKPFCRTNKLTTLSDSPGQLSTSAASPQDKSLFSVYQVSGLVDIRY